jgi:hypothetical protein
MYDLPASTSPRLNKTHPTRTRSPGSSAASATAVAACHGAFSGSKGATAVAYMSRISASPGNRSTARRRSTRLLRLSTGSSRAERQGSPDCAKRRRLQAMTSEAIAGAPAPTCDRLAERYRRIRRGTFWPGRAYTNRRFARRYADPWFSVRSRLGVALLRVVDCPVRSGRQEAQRRRGRAGWRPRPPHSIHDRRGTWLQLRSR